MEGKDHRLECKNSPKGYSGFHIHFFKEAMLGWNWNICVEQMDDRNTQDCYHIKFCPFCGINLDDS